MRRVGGLSVLVVTTLLGGCSVIMHTGVHMGGAHYFGWGYDRGFHGPDRKLSNTTLLIYHSEEERFEDGRIKDRHSCFAMFVPLLWDFIEGHAAVQSTGLEVTASALLLSFRFGFNPGYWFADEEEPAAPRPAPALEPPSEGGEPQAASETRRP
jgi:hypothetical protein